MCLKNKYEKEIFQSDTSGCHMLHQVSTEASHIVWGWGEVTPVPGQHYLHDWGCQTGQSKENSRQNNVYSFSFCQVTILKQQKCCCGLQEQWYKIQLFNIRGMFLVWRPFSGFLSQAKCKHQESYNANHLKYHIKLGLMAISYPSAWKTVTYFSSNYPINLSGTNTSHKGHGGSVG